MDATSAQVTASLQGRTLRELLDGAGSLAERLELLPHLAALSATAAKAHERGVVHRNLHPGNVLVSEHGETVIIDWSFSKERGRDDPHEDDVRRAAAALRPSRPQPNELDPLYFSPEVLQGHMEQVDASSDVYALGAILGEILTGQAPTPEKSAHDLLAERVTNDPDFVTGQEGAPPAALVDVCRRALHKEPTARYATAGPLAGDLRRFAAGERPAASRPPASADTDGPKLLQGAVVVLLAVACFTSFGYVAARRTRDRAIRQKEIQEQARVRADQTLADLARRLEEARAAQARAELERDQRHKEHSQAQLELKRARAVLKKAEEERDDALRALEREKAARGEQETGPAKTDTEAQEAAATDEEPAAPVADEPAEPHPTAEEGPARRADVTRAELLDALPHLIASLVAVEADDGSVEVVVRVVEGETHPGVVKLGFKDGDVITQVNRRPVASLKEAQRALTYVRKDPGFAARIRRNGQSSWMRVNFSEPATAPAAPAPTEAEPEAAPPAPDQESDTPDDDAAQ